MNIEELKCQRIISLVYLLACVYMFRLKSKVIMVGHHPTGGSGMFKEYSHFITDVHARYGDVVILHLLGHSHSDWFALASILIQLLFATQCNQFNFIG